MFGSYRSTELAASCGLCPYMADYCEQETTTTDDDDDDDDSYYLMSCERCAAECDASVVSYEDFDMRVGSTNCQLFYSDNNDDGTLNHDENMDLFFRYECSPDNTTIVVSPTLYEDYTCTTPKTILHQDNVNNMSSFYPLTPSNMTIRTSISIPETLLYPFQNNNNNNISSSSSSPPSLSCRLFDYHMPRAAYAYIGDPEPQLDNGGGCSFRSGVLRFGGNDGDDCAEGPKVVAGLQHACSL